MRWKLWQARLAAKLMRNEDLADVTKLIAYLDIAGEHGLSSHSLPKLSVDPELVQIGEQLSLQTGLDCRQCHAILHAQHFTGKLELTPELKVKRARAKRK